MNKTLRIWLLILGVFAFCACGPNPNGVIPGGPAVLTVRVVNGGTNQPIAGARVSIKKDSQPIAGDQVSGPDGSAIFNITTGDGYKVFAGNVPGLSPGASPSIKLLGNQDIVVQMMPSINQGAGLVAGSVKDGASKAPLAGVTVSLSAGGGAAVQQMRVRQPYQAYNRPFGIMQSAGSTVQTDAAGQFTFNEVPPGSYTVNFQHGNSTTSRSINVNPGETTAIETVFLGGNVVPLPGPGPSTDPTTRGHVLIVEAGRARQLSPQAQVAWQYQSTGLACATRLPDGNTVVVDELIHQASIIGPGGEVVWSMGSSVGLFSRLNAPGWVTAARDGKSFLITDSGNNRIVEIENGAAGWTFGSGLSRPRSAAYTTNGNVLIADTGNRRVIEIDRSGQIIWNFAQDMAAPVHAVRLDDGNTLITDAGYNRVIMVNPQSQPVWFYDGQAAGSPLNRPRSTIATRFGSYLISDTGNNRVLEVDRSKTVINTIPNVARPQVVERL